MNLRRAAVSRVSRLTLLAGVTALGIGMVGASATPQAAGLRPATLGTGSLGLTVGSCGPAAAACVDLGFQVTSSLTVSPRYAYGVITRSSAVARLASRGDVLDGAVWCHGRSLCWMVGATDTRKNDQTFAGATGAIFPYRRGTIGAPRLVRGIQAFLGGVSCPTATTCWATAVRHSTARPWALVRVNPLTGAYRVFVLATRTQNLIVGLAFRGEEISCTSTGACTTVGVREDGTAGTVTTIDNGVLVSTIDVPSVDLLNGISCTSPGVCVAVGANGFASGTLHGVFVSLSHGTASAAQVAPGSGSLSSITCTSATVCSAVGAGAIYPGPAVLARLSGTTVTSARVGSSSTHLDAETCPTSSLCWAVGGSTVRSRNGKSHYMMFLTPFTP